MTGQIPILFLNIKNIMKQFLKNGKIFKESIFKVIKQNAIIECMKIRNEDRFEVFDDLEDMINSKFYKYFRIIQNVIWNHNLISKNKTVFVFEIFDIENGFIKKSVDIQGSIIGADREEDIHNITFPDIDIPRKFNDEQIWKIRNKKK